MHPKVKTSILPIVMLTAAFSSPVHSAEKAIAIGAINDESYIECDEEFISQLTDSIEKAKEIANKNISDAKYTPDSGAMDSCLSGLMAPTLNTPFFGGALAIPSLDSLLDAACDMLVDKMNEQLDALNEAIKEQSNGFFTIIEGDEPTWGMDFLDISYQIPGFEDYEELNIDINYGVGQDYTPGVQVPGVSDAINDGYSGMTDGINNYEQNVLRPSAQEADRELQEKAKEIESQIQSAVDKVFGE